MLGSIPDVIYLSFMNGVRVFVSRISVENDADSGDIGFKCVFEKIVPNLFV
jgi:hypothetical protein